MFTAPVNDRIEKVPDATFYGSGLKQFFWWFVFCFFSLLIDWVEKKHEPLTRKTSAPKEGA
jgi:cytochrome b subunit of formate dehydrogenase